MKPFIEIQWTTASIDEARRICRYLVQERLVASAQIIPWLESIYMWDNQLETVQESAVILKTVEDHFEEIRQLIEKNCTYEVPEITYRLIDGGHQKYLEWLNESLKLKSENRREPIE